MNGSVVCGAGRRGLLRRQFLATLALGVSGAWPASRCIGRAAAAEGSLPQDIERELAAKPHPIAGAVVLIGGPDKVLLHEAVGLAQVAPQKVPMQRDSIFDVASVTKVVATATACAICVDRGLLDPDAPLTRYLPDHQGKGVERISLRRLASHTSGFPENPRVCAAGEGEALFKAMLAESPRWPVNTRYEYACRNTILLSTMVERVTGKTFGDFCQQEIFAPLGMQDSTFNKVAVSPRVVGTNAALGVSHNGDTIAAGRAIGNAGLFTTAADLARFCQMMLQGGVSSGKRILSEKVIADFTRTSQEPQFTPKGFVWSTGQSEKHRPTKLSARAYGHAGWTGIALWIDPEQRLFTLVLSNRVHPKADGVKDVQYAMLSRIGDLALARLGA